MRVLRPMLCLLLKVGTKVLLDKCMVAAIRTHLAAVTMEAITMEITTTALVATMEPATMDMAITEIQYRH